MKAGTSSDTRSAVKAALILWTVLSVSACVQSVVNDASISVKTVILSQLAVISFCELLACHIYISSEDAINIIARISVGHSLLTSVVCLTVVGDGIQGNSGMCCLLLTSLFASVNHLEPLSQLYVCVASVVLIIIVEILHVFTNISTEPPLSSSVNAMFVCGCVGIVSIATFVFRRSTISSPINVPDATEAWMEKTLKEDPITVTINNCDSGNKDSSVQTIDEDNSTFRNCVSTPTQTTVRNESASYFHDHDAMNISSPINTSTSTEEYVIEGNTRSGVLPLQRRRSRVRLHHGVDDESSVKVIKKTLHWKKGDLLGQGGFGKVHIGLNTDTGELMAVKNVTFNMSDPNLQHKIKQLQQEIEIMKPLNHPHIIRYFFTEKDGSSINIFMEYAPGGSIQKLLRSFGPLDEATVVQYTYQILVGLAHLHSKGILHRDIKGGNVLITVEGQVKLADFGASTIVEESVALLKDVKGTPYWMAPEVISEQGHGWEADVWSTGCTVMEMLTADHPWKHLHKTQLQTMEYIVGINISDDEWISLPENVPFSQESKNFMLDCLCRNPSGRPSAQELIEHHFFMEDEDGTSPDRHRRRQSGQYYSQSEESQPSGFRELKPPPLICPDFGVRRPSFASGSGCGGSPKFASPRGAFGALCRHRELPPFRQLTTIKNQWDVIKQTLVRDDTKLRGSLLDEGHPNAIILSPVIDSCSSQENQNKDG